MPPSEAAIQARVRLTLGREPDLVLFRLSQGVGKTPDGRTFRGGLRPGASDLVGVGPGGIWTSIEIKAHRGRLDPKQLQFLTLVQDHGGFACVIQASSLDQATDRARRALELIRGGVVDWVGWPYITEEICQKK